MPEPLQIVTACKKRDLPVLSISLEWMKRMLPFERLYVLAPDSECSDFQIALGDEVSVIKENTFIPGMTLAELRALDCPGFPGLAGWYFQQFLKLQFAFVEPEIDHYLIWDADTIPLRPMEFFDPSGRMIFTKAQELHQPYFLTYRNLFGADPNRTFSFISQHILIQKSVVRQMLASIEERVPGNDNWAWKIMRSLPANSGLQLFSEYETYGHFIKNNFPDRVKFIERNWTRGARGRFGQQLPSKKKLLSLAEHYEFAAFERAYDGIGGFIRILLPALWMKCRNGLRKVLRLTKWSR